MRFTARSKRTKLTRALRRDLACQEVPGLLSECTARRTRPKTESARRKAQSTRTFPKPTRAFFISKNRSPGIYKDWRDQMSSP